MASRSYAARILTGPTRDRSVGIDQVLEAVLSQSCSVFASESGLSPALLFPASFLSSLLLPSFPQLAWAPGSGCPGHGAYTEDGCSLSFGGWTLRSECWQGRFHARPLLLACRRLSSRSRGLPSVCVCVLISHKDISRVVWVPSRMTLSPCRSDSEHWGVRTATCESRGQDSAPQAPLPALTLPFRSLSCFLQLSSSRFLALTCKASCAARKIVKAEKSKCPVSPFSPSINLLCDLNYVPVLPAPSPHCVSCGTV